MKKDIDIEGLKKMIRETEKYLGTLNSSGIPYSQSRPTFTSIPKWHVLANEINEIERQEKKSRKVYSLTQSYITQNARNPRLPVPQTFSTTPEISHLFYAAPKGLPKLQPFPEVIYPYRCWVVYGYISALETLRSEYSDVSHFIYDVKVLGQLKGFGLQEYNPDVSLSYMWGNQAYPTISIGRLSNLLAPDQAEYEQGVNDYYHLIMDEINQDVEP